MQAIKSNMKDQILTSDRKILHCPNCQVEYSGNAGDYWDRPDNYLFYCPDCDEEMELVEKIVTVLYRG